MFIREDLIEFINRIINSSQKEEEIKTNIEKFVEYLNLTKMADKETITQIELILSCLDSVLEIKKVMGSINIQTILNKNKEQNKKEYIKLKHQEDKYEKKHYRHYHYDDDNYSSSCEGGSISTSRC